MRTAHIRAFPPRPAACCRRLHADGGFTLVELITVLIILAVLMAVAIPTYTSAKKASIVKATTATALSYKKAVAAFTLDHQGRVPAWNTTDWPMTTRSPEHPAGSDGPVYPADYSAAGGPVKLYMRGGVPETVSAGQVAIVDSATAGVAQSVRGLVVYTTSGAAIFRLDVYARTRSSKPFRYVCSTGNSELASGLREC